MARASKKRTSDVDEPRAQGAHRLCVATRVERPPEELLRFVAGPDGVIVPDLARRLPGRGVWVTAERRAVDKAVTSRAFARSLKSAVTAPRDLSDQVETLLERRVVEAMSLAVKAGLVVTGFSQVEAALDEGRVALLVHGSDAARDGRDKLDRKLGAICRASGRDARVVDCLSIAQLSLALGRPNVVHAALLTGGATERFWTEAERLIRYRRPLDVAGPAEAERA